MKQYEGYQSYHFEEVIQWIKAKSSFGWIVVSFFQSSEDEEFSACYTVLMSKDASD